MKPLSRAELLKLPPVTNLVMLGRAFGISEPVTRERRRRGEFERMGIRILQLGAQYRVITADVLRVLGVESGSLAAGAADPAAVANEHQVPDKDRRLNVEPNPPRR
jgi:hypothetical protein